MGRLFAKPMIFAAALGLFGCQPLKYGVLSSEEEDGSIRGMSEFQEGFSSSRLDLVIVQEARPGMREILKTNLFNRGLLKQNFLDQFSDYDWRLAHTNTSVDRSLFAKKKKSAGDKKDGNDCELLAGVGAGLSGWFAASPLLVGLGIKTISSCFSSDSSGKKEKKSNFPAVNGAFLPFELQNKKWRDGALFIDKSSAGYNEIFNDTMTLSGKKQPGFFSSEKKKFYEAPEEQSEDSFPLFSVLLSLAKPSHQKQFFRDDSQIIYIVAATVDANLRLSGESLRKAAGQVFGREDRFQLILVSIPSDSAVCRIRFKEAGIEDAEPAIKLQDLAEGLGNEGLSLCSPNLGAELAEEIKKYIHPPNLL